MFDFNTPITEDTTLKAQWYCPPWDPSNPTLEGIKWALDNDIDVPVGTEIPDVFNGEDSPLVVAQYLNENNNSEYGGAVGVILVRKYVTPATSTRFANSYVSYNESLLKTYLDNTYPTLCSAELNSIVSPLTVPCYNGTAIVGLECTYFPPSSMEMGYNEYQSTIEDTSLFFDYWKEKTGLTEPDSNSNSGRTTYTLQGSLEYSWVRSTHRISHQQNRIYPEYVTSSGAIWSQEPNYTGATVQPMCFISKN